jgi:hypothetical protein
MPAVGSARVKIAQRGGIGHGNCAMGHQDPGANAMNEGGIPMRTNIHHPLREGLTVYGSDGEKIGDIASTQSGYFIIEKGWLFPEDVYVPESTVATVDEDEKVHLTLSKEEVEVQDWSAPPMMDADYSADSDVTDRDVLERREERLTVDRDDGDTSRR